MLSGNVEGPVRGLVLLSGLPGAGKTTFAHALARATPATHIESDAVRRLIVPRPAYTRQENAVVFREVERLAARALKAGEVVIVDATNLQRSDRTRFLKLGAKAAVPIVCVRLTAPDGAIRERLSSPREGYSQAGVAVFERARGRVQSFRQRVVVVDTRFETAPSVRLVLRLLRESNE